MPTGRASRTRVKVRIAALAETDDGDILDVEQGDATPEDSVGWVRARRSATGTEKSVYCNLSNIYDVRFAFVAASVALPPLWLAHYDNLPSLPAGFVAKQYADEALTGGHYDASVVADFWPGVDQIDKLGEQDMTVDQLLAMLNDPAVVEKINTFTAIKQVLADQAAAIKAVASAPDHVSDAELADISHEDRRRSREDRRRRRPEVIAERRNH